MLDLYMPALVFLPVLLYAGFGSILFSLGAFTFNKGMTLLVISIAAHITISILAGTWIFALVQTVIAASAFILLIMFFAGKTSGETILTMTALLALTVIPSGLLAFLGTLAAFVVYAVIRLRKSEVAATLYTAVLSSGMAQQLPNYEHMDDRKDLSAEEKRISLMPFMLAVNLLFALFYLVKPMLGDS